MTATPTANTRPKGTAEIAEATASWANSAARAAESYAALRTGIVAASTQALAATGIGPREAEALASALHSSLMQVQIAFADLEKACQAVETTRQEMLAAVTKAQAEKGDAGSVRRFRVVA
jgi:hypothetical protein